MRSGLAIVVLWIVLGGCTGGVVDPGSLDGRPRQDLIQDLGGPIDTSFVRDARPGLDLPLKPGEPCTFGECGEGLICMANVCHAICSTECGDTAPECQPDEGCHWVTSFSAACLPGTASYPEECGGFVRCVGGQLCVTITNQSKTMCLKLCKYGCPTGTICGKTSNGCQVCLPN